MTYDDYIEEWKKYNSTIEVGDEILKKNLFEKINLKIKFQNFATKNFIKGYIEKRWDCQFSY